MTSGETSADHGSVRHAYDTVADHYAELLPDTRAEAPLDLAVIGEFVARVAQDGPVLDAGCGAGRMTRHLADRGCAVEGLDLSPGMVDAARRAHPGLTFTVGSIEDLPFRDASFAGVLLWYSTIHTRPERLDRVAVEVARVLRPGGHVLVGFQAGHGTRDVAPAYRRSGHEVELVRHLRTADEVGSVLGAAGLTEVCRLVRAAAGPEKDQQAVLWARSGPEPTVPVAG